MGAKYMDSQDVELSLVVELARADRGGDPFTFRFGHQQYLLRGDGGGFETAELDWDAELMADLAAIRGPHPEPAILARLGETLRRFLQPAGWSEREVQILRALQEQRRVALTLRFAAAELYSLPWELLTLKSTGQHIAELPGVLVRYEWPETLSLRENPAERHGGRILVGWSAEGGAVPAAEHIAAIGRASQVRPGSFRPELDVCAHASLGRLAAALEAAQSAGSPVTVLHLLCHGRVDGQTFGLSLDGDRPGDHVTVDPGRLRQVLAPYAHTVRLVVLSACDSGNDGAPGNHLGSVAQVLHRAGFANVVASRYPLSVPGSIRLTEVLYRLFLRGDCTVEDAFLAARKDLARDPVHLDWASLQLYARGDDEPLRWGHERRGAPSSRRRPEPRAHAAAIRPASGSSSMSGASPRRSSAWARMLSGAGALLVGGVLAVLGISSAAAPNATEPALAAIASAPAAAPDPAVIDLGGAWWDPNLGTKFQMTQVGDKVSFTAVHHATMHFPAFTSVGEGTIRGHRFDNTYTSTYGDDQNTTGRCDGTISSDGEKITASCIDDQIGPWNSIMIR
jgi:hypothetical protein